MAKKLKVVQMGEDTLKSIVRDTFQEELGKQSEVKKKQQQIDKILKRDSVAKEANKKVVHDDSCPNCHSEIEKLGDGIGVCTDCGITTLEKDTKISLLCDTCGGIVPESFVGTDKNCPHCGGTGVHKI